MRFVIGLLLLVSAAFAQTSPAPATWVPYPRNYTRDQLVISDYSFAPGVVGDWYTVPPADDCWIFSISSTIVADPTNHSFHEIMITPPGESRAIYGWYPVGHFNDTNGGPFLVPGGTRFGRYFSQSAPVDYHVVTIIGILVPHDKTLWGF